VFEDSFVAFCAWNASAEDRGEEGAFMDVVIFTGARKGVQRLIGEFLIGISGE
jgi:hypothetical protein